MRSESSAVRFTAFGIQKLPPLRSSTCLLTRMSYQMRAVIAPCCLDVEWNRNTPSLSNRKHRVVPAGTARPALAWLSGMTSTPAGSANLTTVPTATSPSTTPVNVGAGGAPVSHDTSTMLVLAGPAEPASEPDPAPPEPGAGAAEPVAGAGPGCALFEPTADDDAAPFSTGCTVGAGTAPVSEVCLGCGTIWGAAGCASTFGEPNRVLAATKATSAVAPIVPV